MDRVAEEAARTRGMPDPLIVRPTEAAIASRGAKAALLARNTEIVLETKRRGGVVIAFLLDPPRSGGTLDTLRKCDQYDVPAITFRATAAGMWLPTQVNRTVILHDRWRGLIGGVSGWKISAACSSEE